MPKCLLTGMGWVFITASIYLLNGVTDIDGDRANGSSRPLAAGRLKAGSALGAAALATVVGLALCLWDSLASCLLALCMAALGLVYSLGPKLKRRALGAGVTIGLGAGLTYMAGWSSCGGVTPWRVVFAGGLSCWVAAASATKDFSDVVGDQIAGRRTLAVRLGLRRAGWVVASISALSLLVVLAAGAWTHSRPIVVLPLVVGTAVLGVACGTVSGAADRTGHRVPYRVYMATQYVANGLMLVGSAVRA
jgi:4-hydroxybenzoate polyprenyltransferase